MNKEIELKKMSGERVLYPKIVDSHLFILDSYEHNIRGTLTILYNYINGFEYIGLPVDIAKSLSPYVTKISGNC